MDEASRGILMTGILNRSKTPCVCYANSPLRDLTAEMTLCWLRLRYEIDVDAQFAGCKPTRYMSYTTVRNRKVPGQGTFHTLASSVHVSAASAFLPLPRPIQFSLTHLSHGRNCCKPCPFHSSSGQNGNSRNTRSGSTLVLVEA